jgi:hypothetical protein
VIACGLPRASTQPGRAQLEAVVNDLRTEIGELDDQAKTRLRQALRAADGACGKRDGSGDDLHAACEREGDWCVITVPELDSGGVTQARTLDEVPATVADLVALMTDADPTSAEVNMKVHAR